LDWKPDDYGNYGPATNKRANGVPSDMAAQIKGLDYRELLDAVRAGDKKAKLIRQLGKVANLSLQYRTSPGKLTSIARQPPYEIPMELQRQKKFAIHF
jgi:hypothetical protein